MCIRGVAASVSVFEPRVMNLGNEKAQVHKIIPNSVVAPSWFLVEKWYDIRSNAQEPPQSQTIYMPAVSPFDGELDISSPCFSIKREPLGHNSSLPYKMMNPAKLSGELHKYQVETAIIVFKVSDDWSTRCCRCAVCPTGCECWDSHSLIY